MTISPGLGTLPPKPFILSHRVFSFVTAPCETWLCAVPGERFITSALERYLLTQEALVQLRYNDLDYTGDDGHT